MPLRHSYQRHSSASSAAEQSGIVPASKVQRTCSPISRMQREGLPFPPFPLPYENGAEKWQRLQ